MSKVLVIGCGGVASVAISKCCQVSDVFTELCIASRTKSKCDALAAKLAPNTKTKITTAQVDADDVQQLCDLINSYKPDLVMNIALPYQDLTIMDACLACGVNYMDTANYEPENTDDPEWRAIYEKRCKEAGFSAYFDYSWQWAYKKKFEDAGLTALLGCGFDPGVTQAYCAYAAKHEFDTIDTIDILDCNGGDHGYAFATNFNPEINLREVSAPGSYMENGIYFNIIGTVIFMAAIYGVKAAVGFSWWNDTMNMGDIANFHTLFNVVVTLLFLPFTKLLAKLAEMTIPDKPGEKQDIEIPVLDERLFNSPAVAIQQAKSAVETMARNARANYGEAVPVLYSHNTEVLNLIQQRESVIDKLEVNISNYLVKVTDRELNESESHAVNELINFIVEYERIGDYAINVVERSGEMFDKEITFSESARRELSLVDNAIKEIMDITLAAFQADDTVLAEQVEPLEETIDLMIDTLRERHILRLKNGVCAIESGIIFLEILTNLERISDHCSNIAARIVGKESEDDHFDAHEFRRNMHDGYVPNFNEMLAQYKLKYYTPLLESQETA